MDSSVPSSLFALNPWASQNRCVHLSTMSNHKLLAMIFQCSQKFLDAVTLLLPNSKPRSNHLHPTSDGLCLKFLNSYTLLIVKRPLSVHHRKQSWSMLLSHHRAVVSSWKQNAEQPIAMPQLTKTNRNTNSDDKKLSSLAAHVENFWVCDTFCFTSNRQH